MLITAWWDVNRQFAPGHNPRRRRVRPLRVLERALGHRVKIGGHSRYDLMPPDEYQYTAHSWLDAETIDDAVMFVLRQLSRFERPVHFGPYRLNRQAIANSDDEIAYTIGAFYWNTMKQPPLIDIGSGGVLLHMTSKWEQRHHARAMPAHTIRVPRASSEFASAERANFAISAEIVMMGDPKDVRDFHWPRFRDAYGMHDFEIAAFKGRPGPGNPNYLTVGRPVFDASEGNAICTALACVHGVNLELGVGTDIPLSAIPSSPEPEGLRSLRVVRVQ